MTGRPERRALLIGSGVCLAAVGLLGAASAASLGPLSSNVLGSWSRGDAVPAPAVLVCDNFGAADGTLSGRSVSNTPTCGTATWTTHLGSWTVTSAEVASDGTADASASLAVGATDVTAKASVSNANTALRRGGVVVDHDGVDSYLAAIIVGDITTHADLVLMSAGVPTTLATAVVTVSSSSTVSLTRNGSVATVRIDDVDTIVYSLTTGDIAALGAGSGAGLYASDAAIHFDDLRVTTPAT